MKRVILITMLLWNIFGCQAATPEEWANKLRYARANSELSQTIDGSQVVLIGNSITEFWVELRPGFFDAEHLLGRGISGQVSSQMLARFRQDVLNLQPQIVVINCGTNDIAENNGEYDEDITMDNIESMTELAQAHGIQVVLSSVLPADGFCWNTRVKDAVEKIRHLNRRVSEYCERNHLVYIDYYSLMATPSGALNPAYTEDGVHPNAAGYEVMETALTAVLRKLKP